MKTISNFKEAVLFFAAMSAVSIFAGFVFFTFLVVLGTIVAGVALFLAGCAAVSLAQAVVKKD